MNGYQMPNNGWNQQMMPSNGWWDNNNNGQWWMNGQIPMNNNNNNGPQPFPDFEGMLPIEQSYIENILRLNSGKRARVYMTFENNPEWTAQVFEGIVEEAGRDHIVLSDPDNDTWYLLLMVYLDYVTFDEEIEYDYPFNDIDPAEALAQQGGPTG
ncbi:spore coat protein GerQ [Salsuginibacillus halophilus]|uniref:Spore coat protein GerQ n=1 Tax=Salsuginibacillus halophilus TaxID=517424 RepID=A0A2P8HI40_9BACI|nr:spore coat protein GerQ [Salsuginibacillus halophilus]PSL45877.1 spore coat protein GerQ [Salsuginibacillus halophilus]